MASERHNGDEVEWSAVFTFSMLVNILANTAYLADCKRSTDEPTSSCARVLVTVEEIEDGIPGGDSLRNGS